MSTASAVVLSLPFWTVGYLWQNTEEKTPGVITAYSHGGHRIFQDELDALRWAEEMRKLKWQSVQVNKITSLHVGSPHSPFTNVLDCV